MARLGLLTTGGPLAACCTGVGTKRRVVHDYIITVNPSYPGKKTIGMHVPTYVSTAAFRALFAAAPGLPEECHGRELPHLTVRPLHTHRCVASKFPSCQFTTSQICKLEPTFKCFCANPSQIAELPFVSSRPKNLGSMVYGFNNFGIWKELLYESALIHRWVGKSEGMHHLKLGRVECLGQHSGK